MGNVEMVMYKKCINLEPGRSRASAGPPRAKRARSKYRLHTFGPPRDSDKHQRVLGEIEGTYGNFSF